MDLMPTLTELAGVQVVGTNPLDGVSVAPLLSGASRTIDRTLVHHWKNKISVRTQRFRLDHNGQLYDIYSDPGQNVAVNKEQPDVEKKLKKIAETFRKDLLVDYGKEFDHRPFTIGHPDTDLTQIPARDGVAHGHIERSNRFPNDSFFTNWTHIEDAITWEGNVGMTGTYQVDIFYTCPKKDIGSTITLSFGDSALIGKISEPHDPPLSGMEHDRFERTESYVKNFRRMTLGTIRLKKGRGKLKLQASNIPGAQVMDFRLLLLKRIEQ